MTLFNQSSMNWIRTSPPPPTRWDPPAVHPQALKARVTALAEKHPLPDL
jgi:hypothetical protein